VKEDVPVPHVPPALEVVRIACFEPFCVVRCERS
jgi:hypothetical protein